MLIKLVALNLFAIVWFVDILLNFSLIKHLRMQHAQSIVERLFNGHFGTHTKGGALYRESNYVVGT